MQAAQRDEAGPQKIGAFQRRQLHILCFRDLS